MRMDIVALIFNADMVNLLFSKDDHHHWSQNSVLKGLRVPFQLVNPLFKTLKELVLNRIVYHFKSNGVATKFDYASALRHLPELENLEIDVPTIQVVELLYDVGADNQESFEKAWKNAASSLGLDVEKSCMAKLPMMPS